jgi:hypothetical protein
MSGQLPSQSELQKVLQYDPSTGALTWLERKPEMFEAGKQTREHNCAIWNGKFAGRPGLSSPDKRGYLTGHLFSRPMKAHRVIWALVHGVWPLEIDHINGDTADNRLSNLRAVSHAINGRNLRRKVNNTSGVCGVYKRPSGRWCASITVSGKDKSLGTFDTLAEAAQARAAAEAMHGFHPDHGRRA